MSDLILSVDGEAERAADAQRFCQVFCGGDRSIKRYIFGRNVYAADVVRQLNLDGVVDDFTEDTAYLGLPVIKSGDLPAGALVLALSGGYALTVKDKLAKLDVWALDYFAFRRWSGLALAEVVFNEQFAKDFQAHQDRYEWVHGLLKDEVSRQTFSKLVSFRLKGDVELLRGFTNREKQQYFEDFLQLRPQGEVFFDIGGFDGFTSQEFIRHCPEYGGVHLFEPEPANFARCVDALAAVPRVSLHNVGLGAEKKTLTITSAGSGSSISEHGSQTIHVERLDSLGLPAPTFLKIDIEGAELSALAGARETIGRSHPTLALAVYHYAGGEAPFWQIPQSILSIRDDYDIYLRHYTESIYETVMFFVPK